MRPRSNPPPQRSSGSGGIVSVPYLFDRPRHDHPWLEALWELHRSPILGEPQVTANWIARHRNWIDELVAQQASQQLPDTNNQYRENIVRWPNNEVAANGLADVLKARGELDAAERQYRGNIARRPNDGVARHGLANVLRKQRRHAESLQLIADPGRAPVSRRPSATNEARVVVVAVIGVSQAEVSSLAADPGGKWLASAGNDRLVHRWVLGDLSQAPVCDLAFEPLPEGRRLRLRSPRP